VRLVGCVRAETFRGRRRSAARGGVRERRRRSPSVSIRMKKRVTTR
jgi:hypothetical protein